MKRARHRVVGTLPRAGEASGWDGYRFGSESCSNLVPSAEQMREAAGRLSPGRCVLVTPLLGPEELDGTLRCAAAAIDGGWAEVVVNDWGLLDELRRAGAKNIAAGRLLMRFRRGPGETDPWRELDEEARRYFAWGPLYDSPFIEFLREMGVGRVEADLPRHPMPVPQAGGLAISLHAQNRLVSLAASCPWLYDPIADCWSDAHACSRPCRSRGDMILHAGPLASPLRLRGRATIELTGEHWHEEDLPTWVDRLIFDEPLPSGTFPA